MEVTLKRHIKSRFRVGMGIDKADVRYELSSTSFVWYYLIREIYNFRTINDLTCTNSSLSLETLTHFNFDFSEYSNRIKVIILNFRSSFVFNWKDIYYCQSPVNFEGKYTELLHTKICTFQRRDKLFSGQEGVEWRCERYPD